MEMGYNSQELLAKWSNAEKFGGLSVQGLDENLQESMAILLENQDRKDNAGNILTEATSSNTTTNIGQLGSDSAYKPISMALVRRTFPALFAQKVVGVQPMATPVGLAYAIRMIYADISNGNVGPEAAWDQVPTYSGFTGSTSGTSATYNTSGAGTGVDTSAAEGWQIGVDMPELKAQLEQTAIVAKSRKLAATFSLEAIEDIRAMQNIDIQRKMISELQYEIIAELDRELIAKLKTTAVSGTGGAAATSLDFNATSGSSYIDGRWSQEQLSSLLTAIIYQSEVISTSTRRGPGNFVIVSPAVATALQSIRPAFQGVTAKVKLGRESIAKIGTLNGTIDVYRDQYASSNYALIGYKGPESDDAGVIYSPYKTLLINTAVAQEDFSPRVGVRSRYAITDSLLGSGRYYRMVNVANINKVIAGAS